MSFRFSVAKATLHSQMSVRPFIRLSVCLSSKPLNSLKSSFFIIHPSTLIIFHSSFLHFATFKLFSLLYYRRLNLSSYSLIGSVEDSRVFTTILSGLVINYKYLKNLLHASIVKTQLVLLLYDWICRGQVSLDSHFEWFWASVGII